MNLQLVDIPSDLALLASSSLRALPCVSFFPALPRPRPRGYNANSSEALMGREGEAADWTFNKRGVRPRPGLAEGIAALGRSIHS